MPGLLLASIVLTTASTIGTTTLLYKSDSLDSFWLAYAILVSLGMGFTPLAGYILYANYGSNALVGVALLDFLIIGVLYPPFYDLEPVMRVGTLARTVNAICIPGIVLAGLFVYGTLVYFTLWGVNALFAAFTNAKSLA